MSSRIEINLLDDANPFEIDEDNLPHLFKHGAGERGIHFDLDVLDDIYTHDEPLFYEVDPDGEADWLMLGHVQGEVVTVPLAPPRSGLANKCRPIGMYTASRADRAKYYSDIGRWR